jgi:hypothetical protein
LKSLFTLGMSISTHFIMISDCLKNSEGTNLKISYIFCKEIMKSLDIEMPLITLLINKQRKMNQDFADIKDDLINFLKFPKEIVEKI